MTKKNKILLGILGSVLVTGGAFVANSITTVPLAALQKQPTAQPIPKHTLLQFPQTQEEREEIARALISEIRALYEEASKEYHWVGYSAVIVLDGKILEIISQGETNLTTHDPVTPDTMFPWASNTKNFTALAIMKLADEGKLDPNAPLSKYLDLNLPPLTKDTKPVTLLDLMTHRAGFATDDPQGDRLLDLPPDTLIDLLKSKGVYYAAPQGMSFDYSNLAYALLGIVINNVSGMPYEEYITKNICEPLGMKIAWDFNTIPSDELTTGYQLVPSDEGIVPREEPFLGPGSYGAMGGMFTSIRSFAEWIRFHLDAYPPRDAPEKGPLPRATVRRSHESMGRLWIEGDSVGSAGLGLFHSLYFEGENKGKRMIGHPGGLPYSGSSWDFMPEYGIGVAMCTNVTYAGGNRNHSAASETNVKVLSLLTGEDALKPWEYVPPEALLSAKDKLLVAIRSDWKDIEPDTFTANFFQDFSKEWRKKQTDELLNLLGGSFTVSDRLFVWDLATADIFLTGENGVKATVRFYLSPINPPLIQACDIIFSPE